MFFILHAAWCCFKYGNFYLNENKWEQEQYDQPEDFFVVMDYIIINILMQEPKNLVRW